MSPVHVALYKGPGRWADWVVRRWQRSPYSHCEVITAVARNEYAGDSFECWSSSNRDGGVRRKVMHLNPDHWDLFSVRSASVDKAREWFEQHEGNAYDWFGLLGFVWRPWRGNGWRWWCSEACAAAMGFSDPHRFDVATLASVVKRIGRGAKL